jgi:cytochrome P450
MDVANAASQWPLPDVPAELIVDFDMFAVEPVDDDLHAGWHRWHSAPDLFYTARNGGHWVATRADDIYEIVRDHERFSNNGVAMIRDRENTRFIPGEVDPPVHTAFRKILNPETSPRRVREFEDSFRNLCIELVESLRPLGQCEFHDAVAEKMPIYNFLNFMNLPIEHATILLPPAATLGRNPDMESFARALSELHAYIEARIDERLETETNDFIGRLIRADVDGRPISRQECLVTILNVMLGGLDTVTASMGFFFNFLARNPSHRRQLVADPGMIPEAIEELLRRHGIFNNGRLVKEDCDFRGVRLRRNDLILLSSALHNLDERRFPDPLEVQFDRVDRGHATFGFGVHRCLGSNIARAQLRILLEEWLKRIPDFAIAPGKTTGFRSGRANMVTELPLIW